MGDRPRGVRPLGALLVGAVLMGAAACGDAAPVSAPGALTVTLESPNGAEGAALLRLVGGGVSSVAPLTGELHTSAVGDTTTVLVLLDLPGQIAFTVSVADTTRPPVAAPIQVADGENGLRTDLTGYGVRYTP